MKILGLKPRTHLIILLLMLAAVIGVAWVALPGIISSQITAALKDAGFKQAEIGRVDVYYNATHIQDIRLAPAGPDSAAIDEAEIYYSPANLLSGRIDRVFIDGIILTARQSDSGIVLDGMTDTQNNAPPPDIPALLSNIPVDAVEMRSADLRLDLGDEVITLNLAGRMARGPSGAYALHGRMRGRSENADISAKIEGAIETSGAATLSLKISEAGIDHKLISTNRFTGWAGLDMTETGQIDMNAEIAAGVLDIGGTELRGVTLTYTNQDNAHHLIARALVDDKGGKFILDYDATPQDDQYRVTATLEATDFVLSRIPQLASLSGQNIEGIANIRLDAGCRADAPLPPTSLACTQTHGTAAVNLTRLDVGDLFSDGVIKLDLNLADTQTGLRLSAAEGAEISLVPGTAFPAVETVTDFSGARLTLNLTARDETPPFIELAPDGRVRIGGGFSVNGRNGNAATGVIGGLTLTPGYAPLPDIDAQDVQLHLTLARINTTALTTDKAIFDFSGDIRIDGQEQSLALFPDRCVQIKAQKLNAGIYRPEHAFDSCIPLGSASDDDAAEATNTDPWLQIKTATKPDGAITIRQAVYNGGIPTLPLDVMIEDTQSPLQITSQLPEGQIRLVLDENFMPVDIRAELTGGGRLTTSKAPFALAGFSGTAAYKAPAENTPARLDTGLNIARLTHIAKRPYFLPLSVTLESSTNMDRQETKFTASAMDEMGAFVAELDGTHKLAAGSGFGTFKIYPVDFGLIAPPMQDAFPVLRNWVNQATGKVTVDTAISWDKVYTTAPTFDGSGTITLEDGVIETQDVTAAGIQAKITLDDIVPLTLPPGQSLSVRAADLGIPLTDGDITFSLTADGILDIAKFNWKLAGGVIRTDPFAIPLDAPAKTIRLQARDIDLAQLAMMAEIEGLEATGVLNGAIPVTVSPQGFDINKGLLKAIGNGVIRYNPDEVPPALAGSNEQIKTVRNALKNLQYKNLSMEISGGSQGTQNIALHISGKNPDFYGGHPVELNLNLEGDLGALIRRTLNALGYTDQLIRDTLKNRNESPNPSENPSENGTAE